MSAEGDVKRLKRDQDRMFDQLEERVRHHRDLITAEEFATKVRDVIGLRLAQSEQIDALTPQLVDLGRLAGMSDAKADDWANFLIREAKRELGKAPR
jgi:hypothetical protein